PPVRSALERRALDDYAQSRPRPDRLASASRKHRSLSMIAVSVDGAGRPDWHGCGTVEPDFFRLADSPPPTTMPRPWGWHPHRAPPTRTGRISTPEAARIMRRAGTALPLLSRVLRVTALGQRPEKNRRPPVSARAAMRAVPGNAHPATGHGPGRTLRAWHGG